MKKTLQLDLHPDLTFDPRSLRFRWRDTRQFASMEAVRSQARTFLDRQQGELVRLSDHYFSQQLTLKGFQTEAAEMVKSIHLANLVLALDKAEQLTSEKFLIVGRQLKAQYYAGKDKLTGERFGLKYLAQDLQAQQVSIAQLANRLALFGDSGKLTYWDVKRDNARASGKTRAVRVLGLGEHCPDCPKLAGKILPLSDILLPGQGCACRTRCKCSLKFL